MAAPADRVVGVGAHRTVEQLAGRHDLARHATPQAMVCGRHAMWVKRDARPAAITALLITKLPILPGSVGCSWVKSRHKMGWYIETMNSWW
jgi:hypothetical protein